MPVIDPQMNGGSNVRSRDTPVIATTPVKPSLRAASADLDALGDGRGRAVELLENRADKDDAIAERAEAAALDFAALVVEADSLNREDVRGVGEEAPLYIVHLFEMRAGMHGRLRVAQRGDDCRRAHKLLAIAEG